MTTDARARAQPVRVALPPIGSRRIEQTLAGTVSVFGVLFALITAAEIAEQWPHQRVVLASILVVAVYGTILLSALAALLRQWTTQVFWACGLVYLAALALWPLSMASPFVGAGMPWLLALSGVPCAFVIVAARWQLAAVYVLGVSAAIGMLRTTPPAGGVNVATAALDTFYATELGLALLVVTFAVRRAARTVDTAQGAALDRYADAQIDEATEAERTRTDALVHDSVLTTFLSAAGATTPETRVLASRMALNAMHVLSRATVASHSGPKVPVADLLGRVRADAADVGAHFEFGVADVRDHSLPEQVADAIVSAAVQAMTNSVKHAGGPEIPRHLTVQGTAAGGVQVIVEDGGRGFDPSAVASERLGLRVSILERMRLVGGEVEIKTAIGEGTTFVLSWPAAEPGALGAPTSDEEVVLA